MSDTSTNQAADKQAVMVEIKIPEGIDADSFDLTALDLPGFEVDKDYAPVPMQAPAGERSLETSGETLLLIRGRIDTDKLTHLKADPKVYNVWTDTPIAPFSM